MRYIYFPTGRDTWLQVSLRLRQMYSMEPVIWVGDNRHLDVARENFPDCCVLDLVLANKGRAICDQAPADDVLAAFMSSTDFKCIRYQVIKMMDRQDWTGTYRLLEREATFFRMLTCILALLKQRKPEALVMAESPHSPVQLLVYRVCLFLDIPIIFFASFNSVPALLAKRKIESLPVSLPASLRREPEVKICREVNRYFDAFSERCAVAIEPGYMRLHREKERASASYSLSRWIRERRRASRALHLQTSKNKRGWHNNYQMGLFENGVKKNTLACKILRVTQHFYRNSLVQSYNQYVSREPILGKYVYFPLHYEPERTTNPDGGKFYSQYDALVRLRSLVPPDTTLVVKEHFSQLAFSQQGYVGRSPLFYRAITGMHNVKLVGLDYPSIALAEGAEFVATITGTVGIEAACLGKPVLIFGWPWYVGCPGTITYREGMQCEDIMATGGTALDEVREFVSNLLANSAITACINPSNRKYFSAFYDEVDEAKEAEHIARVIRFALTHKEEPV